MALLPYCVAITTLSHIDAVAKAEDQMKLNWRSNKNRSEWWVEIPAFQLVVPCQRSECHTLTETKFFFRFDCNAFMLVYFLIACHKNQAKRNVLRKATETSKQNGSCLYNNCSKIENACWVKCTRAGDNSFVCSERLEKFFELNVQAFAQQQIILDFRNVWNYYSQFCPSNYPKFSVSYMRITALQTERDKNSFISYYFFF